MKENVKKLIHEYGRDGDVIIFDRGRHEEVIASENIVFCNSCCLECLESDGAYMPPEREFLCWDCVKG